MPSHRMHRGLVTLSASAVAAIYFAGYLRTQAADAALGAATTPTPTVTSRLAVATPQPSPSVAVITRSAPTPQISPTSPTLGVTPYKDGTYTGTGTSRRGDVWVSVQIQGGKIANVTITRSTLQYPLRDIASLPSQVVQRQSAQVDIVTRATYSSMAFRGAVSQALASATAA